VASGRYHLEEQIMSYAIPITIAALIAASAPAKGTPDGDEVACQGKKAGAACVDEDGEPGTCQPDDDPPHVLECEDGD
jgi:hypothetical protein